MNCLRRGDEVTAQLAVLDEDGTAGAVLGHGLLDLGAEIRLLGEQRLVHQVAAMAFSEELRRVVEVGLGDGLESEARHRRRTIPLSLRCPRP